MEANDDVIEAIARKRLGAPKPTSPGLRVEHWEGEPRLVGDSEFGQPQRAKKKLVECDATTLAGVPVLTAYKGDGTEVRVRKGPCEAPAPKPERAKVKKSGPHTMVMEAKECDGGFFGTDQIKKWFEQYDNTAGSSCSEELLKIAEGMGERFKGLTFAWEKGFLHINGGKTLIQMDTVRDAYRTLGTLGVDKDVRELVVKLLAKKVGTLFCGLR